MLTSSNQFATSNSLFGQFYLDDNGLFEHFGVTVWECYIRVLSIVLYFWCFLKIFFSVCNLIFFLEFFSCSSHIDFIL